MVFLADHRVSIDRLGETSSLVAIRPVKICPDRNGFGLIETLIRSLNLAAISPRSP